MVLCLTASAAFNVQIPQLEATKSARKFPLWLEEEKGGAQNWRTGGVTFGGREDSEPVKDPGWINMSIRIVHIVSYRGSILRFYRHS